MASKEYKFPAFDEAPKVEGMVSLLLFFFDMVYIFFLREGRMRVIWKDMRTDMGIFKSPKAISGVSSTKTARKMK